MMTMRAPRIDGLIPAGTLLRGTLEFSGSLWVDAEIHGDVRSRAGTPSMLFVGPKAKIFGTIEADQIMIYGSVTGRVLSRTSLRFEHGAQVIAQEIVHSGFTICSGAHVEGTLVPPPSPQHGVSTIPPTANVQRLRAGHRGELPVTDANKHQQRPSRPVSM